MSKLFMSSSRISLSIGSAMATAKPILVCVAGMALIPSTLSTISDLTLTAWAQEDIDTDEFDEEDPDDFDGDDGEEENFDGEDFDFEDLDEEDFDTDDSLDDDFGDEAEVDFETEEEEDSFDLEEGEDSFGEDEDVDLGEDDDGGDDDDRDDADQDDDREDFETDDDDDVRLDPDEIEFEAATGIDPDDFEYDEMGFPARSNEILAFDLGEDALAIARDLGFELIERQELVALGGSIDRLRVPDDYTLSGAVEALDSTLPAAPFDYNHIYLLPEGDADGNQSGQSAPIGQPRGGVGIRLGVIDTMVDPLHPSLKSQSVTVRDFADQGGRDTAHGTAVVSILVGQDASDGYSGLVPGAKVYAANVFTIGDTGLPSTNTLAMVEALDWVASQNVDVISISIAGPDSAIISEVISRIHARDQIVVAAVGNDGPAAPPLFPASYEDVVGVTAIDLNQRVFRRAGRGSHVDFSAPGVRVRAANTAGGYTLMSGTSFATPVVAALVALRASNGSTDIQSLLWDLSTSVQDLGAPGRDDVFGHGLLLVGEGQ